MIIDKKLNDQTKGFVLGSLLKGNRKEMYEYYITYAERNDYEIDNMSYFYNLRNQRNGKHLILRHDVDLKDISTRRMFELEKKLGITSTYYFRFSTIDKKLINEMVDSGFEVGFHFETISDYVKKWNIKDRKQLDFDLLRQQLKKDIIQFESIIGHKINSCCSHGASENIRIGVSNNVLTDGQIMKDFGVEFESYGEDVYKNIDCHIMDCRIINNYGFAYMDSPLKAMNSGKQNIIFLSHPNHWFFPFFRRCKCLLLFVLGKATYSSQRVFERIAGNK